MSIKDDTTDHLKADFEVENPYARELGPRGKVMVKDPDGPALTYALLAVAFELWYGRRQH